MKIDHIGIVVPSIEQAILHWKNVFGYEQMTTPVVNTRQKVKVVFLRKQDSIAIKLIEPIDETSTIYKAAMQGGGLHHLCFKCDDLLNELSRLKQLGLRVLEQPQPGEAFENEPIAFVFAKNGLNIELIQTDKKANRIDRFQSHS